MWGALGSMPSARKDGSARLVTRITWIGHSTVLVELDGVRLLTDPVLRRRFVHLRRVGADPDATAIGPLDAVLVSHLHYDHLDVRSLARLGRPQRIIVPAGAARLLRKRGFTAVEELERGEEANVSGVAVRATHAEHAGRRSPLGAEAPAVGYLIAGSTHTYFAGDTDLFGGMSDLSPHLDVALLPVAGWGFRIPAGHLDPRRAAEALKLLRPRLAVPIHWWTYRPIGFASGARSLDPPHAFRRHALELAREVEVVVLPVGGTLEVRTAARATPSGATA